MEDAQVELHEIITDCQSGDRRAQETIYRRYHGKMYAICLRYTKNEDQAKDILQESFIKVFGKIKKFQFDGSFEGWVRRIVVNTAIDHFRKSKSDLVLMEDETMVESFAEPYDDADENEDEFEFSAAQVIIAMQKLSPAYRTIFNLYVFENLTHKEIAERLKINEGTSKSNYSKAKKNLKKILLNTKSNA